MKGMKRRQMQQDKDTRRIAGLVATSDARDRYAKEAPTTREGERQKLCDRFVLFSSTVQST